jgi:hypothetical protein
MKQENLKLAQFLIAAGMLGALSACTGQIPGSFRLAQQEQTFSSEEEVNTKIDLLWVVDNSASMDVTQNKLRAGFSSFAQKYMKPTWDIRVAVITTDVYMADSAFNTYRNTVIPGTVGCTSTHIASRLATWQNPTWNPTLVNTTTGAFTNGVKYGELIPSWGPSFARLLPGMHDGPITALCSEIMPYFLNGPTRCNIRDDQARATGVAKCLNPSGSETAITECVNTVQNDTVHSGKAILSTMPPTGVAGDAAWTQALINNFMINVSRGSAGQGSERGLGSVLELIEVNESTATAFFRPGSLRGVIFVSDEEDQTMPLPSNPAAGFNPQTNYACDQASIAALNPTQPALTAPGGYCCAGGSCRYGANGTSCPLKTVDGYSYRVSLCPVTSQLTPVTTVKNQLDAFFSGLDGAGADPNYFVASIVPTTAQAIQGLQALRDGDDIAIAGMRTQAVDRGDRYIELGNLVGNGSLALDISVNDYSPILDAIGRSIIEKKATFRLTRLPTGGEDMLVWVVHANGSTTQVPSSIIQINASTITITDLDFVLGLAATDKIAISYQPKTVADRQ